MAADLISRMLGRLRALASGVDDWLDARRMRRRGASGQDHPVTVTPYPGYIAGGVLRLRGSVVEAKKLEKPGPRATTLGDLAVTIGRFAADEIMGARVRVRCRGVEAEAVTDSDGYFIVELPMPEAPPPAPDERWRAVETVLEDFPGRSQPPLSVQGVALEPPPEARLLIISDIDDTVLRTGLAEPLKNWRTMIESDAEARVAFPGLSALYRGLERGGGDTPVNPVCYVSTGSWNLHDLVSRFMEINDIPKGPIFMDDWGLTPERWVKSGHDVHKARRIDELLAAFPGLDVILIGDSGQHDAEIYRAAIDRHGERIKAVWIRDVASVDRDAAVEALFQDAAGEGRSLHAEPDLAEAAEDAARRGWIDAQALAAVRAEVAAVT